MHPRMRTLIIASTFTCAALFGGAAAAGSGSDGSHSVLTVTMRVPIADDNRVCPPGTPAECFSRKGAAVGGGLSFGG